MAKAEAATLYQVKESFSTVYKGLDLLYREGEAVHPDDPLLRKYPEHFEPLKFPHDPVALAALPEPEPPPEAPADPATPDPATPEERVTTLIDEHTREELDALAAEVGIADPADLPNKQAVAEAIVGTAEPVEA